MITPRPRLQVSSYALAMHARRVEPGIPQLVVSPRRAITCECCAWGGPCIGGVYGRHLVASYHNYPERPDELEEYIADIESGDEADYGYDLLRRENGIAVASGEPEDVICRNCGNYAIDHGPGRLSIFGRCPE